MAKARNSSLPAEAKTITWFQHEIMANTPKQSILDATSLGIFSIAEQSGKLVGAWKQHRLLLQDLDTELVAVALGELLAAVVQTADAIGMPLDAVVDQQVERARLQVQTGAPRRRAPAAPSVAPANPPLLPASKPVAPPSKSPLPPSKPVVPASKPAKPASKAVSQPEMTVESRQTIRVPDANVAIETPAVVKRGRGRPRKIVPTIAELPVPVRTDPPPSVAPVQSRRRQPVAPATIQPALLVEPVVAKKRAAKSSA